MQAGKTNKIKKAVDVCMTVLLLCLMAYQVTGETLHEWFGIGMTALLILHHILNRKWYAALFRGRYNAYRIAVTAVNTLLLAAIALTAVCGMAMSAHAVPFMYGILPAAFARRFHLAMSYWSFILMGVHLGLHVPVMAAGMRLGEKAGTAADATDEATVKFVDAYQKSYGETPIQFAADAYDAIYIIKAAIEQANVTPDQSVKEIGDALKSTITTIKYDGITGSNMTWDASGEVSKAPMAIIIKDGAYASVE